MRSRTRSAVHAITGLTPPLQNEGQEPTLTPDSNDSDQLLDVTVPSLSGHFIQLEDEGKADRLVELLAQREKLQLDLQSTDTELSWFKNPLWLLQSYIRIRNTGAKFGPTLKAQARALEKRKLGLAVKLNDIENAISKIDPVILQVIPTRAREPLPTRLPGIAADESPIVLVRDYLIKQASAQGWSDKEICARLDAELQRRDEPPWGIPERWVDLYGEQWKIRGWNFYSAAYKDKRTKNLMQKIISKAKVRIP